MRYVEIFMFGYFFLKLFFEDTGAPRRVYNAMVRDFQRGPLQVIKPVHTGEYNIYQVALEISFLLYFSKNGSSYYRQYLQLGIGRLGRLRSPERFRFVLVSSFHVQHSTLLFLLHHHEGKMCFKFFKNLHSFSKTYIGI